MSRGTKQMVKVREGDQLPAPLFTRARWRRVRVGLWVVVGCVVPGTAAVSIAGLLYTVQQARQANQRHECQLLRDFYLTARMEGGADNQVAAIDAYLAECFEEAHRTFEAVNNTKPVVWVPPGGTRTAPPGVDPRWVRIDPDTMRWVIDPDTIP